MRNIHEENNVHTEEQTSLTHKVVRAIFKIMDKIFSFCHYHILTIYSLVVMATVIFEVKLSLFEKICYIVATMGATVVNELVLSRTE